MIQRDVGRDVYTSLFVCPFSALQSASFRFISVRVRMGDGSSADSHQSLVLGAKESTGRRRKYPLLIVSGSSRRIRVLSFSPHSVDDELSIYTYRKSYRDNGADTCRTSSYAHAYSYLPSRRKRIFLYEGRKQDSGVKGFPVFVAVEKRKNSEGEREKKEKRKTTQDSSTKGSRKR